MIYLYNNVAEDMKMQKQLQFIQLPLGVGYKKIKIYRILIPPKLEKTTELISDYLLETC